MITAVDTNVLLDLLIPGSSEMESAANQIRGGRWGRETDRE